MTTENSSEDSSSKTTGILGRIWRSVSVPLLSIILALLIGAIILLLSGANPLTAYAALFQGALGSPEAIGRTLEKTTPLIFGGLAVAFAFQAGLFNIGGQGQLLVGAIVAAYIGFAIEGLAIYHPYASGSDWRQPGRCSMGRYCRCSESLYRST